MFLEISQNSKENTCARVSILIKLQAWGLQQKRSRHKCFTVNFAKFLRTHFLTEHLWWLLLRAPNFVSVPRLCTIQNTSNSLAKGYLRIPFLQNSSQWLLPVTAPSGCLEMSVIFLRKWKNRNNFSYLLWP